MKRMSLPLLGRREFITLLGGTAAWPLVARAQQSSAMRRIGTLFFQSEPEVQERLAAFLQGLEQAGWSEGRNLQIDRRWGMGDAERVRRQAAGLVGLTPDVIFTGGFKIGRASCRERGE